MQKQLVMLAAMASSVAMAQDNVTIYGVADYGYSYRFDARSLDARGNVQPSSRTPSSSSTLNSGQASSGRIGFMGTENLGDGLKALFLMEQGYTLDYNNGESTSGLLFTRQAYLGLSGDWGRAIGGRLYTPYYDLVLSMDPFANGTVGAFKNPWSFGTNVEGSTLTNPVRVDNAFSYTTPNFAGFSATGFFSNNVAGNDSVANNARNSTMYGVLGQYKNGPLVLGGNYHYIASGTATGAATLDNVQNFTFATAYDFGVARISGVYAWNEIEYSDTRRPSAGLNNYLLAASVPFGKWTAKASYIYSDGKQYGDSQQLAMGLNYNLSKRTDIYSAYSWIDNTGSRMSAVNDASNNGTYAAGNGFPTAGVWQQGFQLGVRHRF